MVNILLVTRFFGKTGNFHLGSKGLITLFLLAFVAIPTIVGVSSYRMGLVNHPDGLTGTIISELDSQKISIDTAIRDANENLGALSQRLGTMQSHIIRLDALGQRLTKMAELDKGEFNFEYTPARGGPGKDANVEPIQLSDFVDSMQVLSQQIEDRSKQLAVLETMMMTSNLQDEILPAGRPIKKGWISSYFGWRTNPFGKGREHHDGMDFAGKSGSEVLSVAAGVVTWAGKRYGYGNLVEVNHGNGYATRYGHNEEVVVKVGQTVKKGEVLSKMGSTGRSTGPHVHFEVLRHGRTVNPDKYIQASR
ncbi:MAG: M23 family metallopeptidase [Gammaproteobacteria bacterium]|nr:M23 family metallopeptidase [Gammaproteobacteria bacterium]